MRFRVPARGAPYSSISPLRLPQEGSEGVCFVIVIVIVPVWLSFSPLGAERDRSSACDDCRFIGTKEFILLGVGLLFNNKLLPALNIYSLRQVIRILHLHAL